MSETSVPSLPGLTGFIDIGPECFADSEATVISYKGDNFYRACDVLVAEFAGGASHCVKRVNHPNRQHEDFYGRVRDEDAVQQLSEFIYFNSGEDQTYPAAEALAAQIINEGWTKQ